MKILNAKTTLTAILILLLTLSALALGIQPVKANDKSATYMFVAVTPTGVGQNIQVVFWMSFVTPDALENTGSRWQGVTVAITKPDGTTDSRGPYTLDAVASWYFYYPATTVGKYSFQASFPGQTIPAFFNPMGLSSSVPIDFAASKSPVVTVTITQTPAPAPHDVPLPSGYWTRPINGQNANWWSISSNWLLPAWDNIARQFDQGSAVDAWTKAPNTAHILWTKPLTFGGLAGGEFGGTSFHNGMSYEQFFKPPVIISGRLYYNTIVANEPTAAAPGVNTYTTVTNEAFSSITCVDMNTGQTLFTIPNASLAFGQIYEYTSPNQGGTFAYLWDTNGAGGTWKMYDAWTGDYMLSLANVPSGTIMLDNTLFGSNGQPMGQGDILIYTLNSAAGTLSMWNSTRVLLPRTPESLNPISAGINALVGQNPYTWRPAVFLGQTLNATGITTMNIAGFAPLITNWDTNGTQWTVPLSSFPAGAAQQQIGYDNTVWVMAGTGSGGAVFASSPHEIWAGYSMTNGALLSGPTTIDLTSKIPANASAYAGAFATRLISSDGILPVFVKETMSWYAWNLKTGQFMWGPTTPYTNAWGMFNYESDLVVNGILYNWGFDGMVHAFDVETGTPIYTFFAGDAGSLNPYGVNALYQGVTIADGKLFATTGDHGNGAQPLYQGEMLYAIDATHGTSIWNITGWFTDPAIADGVLLSQNLYDNQIYAFGQGPTATTVTTSPVMGSSSKVVIQGTVTDQSPGAKGTPAVSDESMSAWMEYLFEQQPCPTQVIGVPVVLSAIDPNGNTQNIGTVMTDAIGHYATMWTPPVPGLYTLSATFLGTHSYYTSYAITSFGVSPAASPAVSPGPPATVPPSTSTPSPTSTVAPSVAPTPTQPASSAAPSMTLYIVVAVVAIIIVVAAAAVVLSRRRK